MNPVCISLYKITYYFVNINHQKCEYRVNIHNFMLKYPESLYFVTAMGTIAEAYFNKNNWNPYPFQKDAWNAIASGYDGLLHAPTGSGKTYALWMGILEQYYSQPNPSKGLHCLWLSPLRALSKEIQLATTRVSETLQLSYTIGLRTGDTSASVRSKQKAQMPHGLISTPESLHLLLSQKQYPDTFKQIKFVVIDEWHELMGSKRGVLVALAISRLKALQPELCVWGISATIGNLAQAQEVLLGPDNGRQVLISSHQQKSIQIATILPELIDKFPWGGHLGISLLDQVVPIINNSRSTLLFTNTRSQCEIWYQRLLTHYPDFAGQMALHHGSLSEEVRQWVEQALHDGILKVVVCTSSLDLGVDFRPVDTIIQIGSPKGVGRFLQRAGRSGHQPGATSIIYFLPTHSLEILEGSALRTAAQQQHIETRIPYIRCFDVLIQYMVTLAVAGGFDAQMLFNEVKNTYCFESITEEEFNWCLQFITQGGQSLEAYDEYHKVIIENGLYKVINRSIAMRHRLSIGTIVSDTMLQVKLIKGSRLGGIEEHFITRLKPGDVFWFAGRNLKLVQIKDMTALVEPSKSNKGSIPAWSGGRMPLSSELSATLRDILDTLDAGEADAEINSLRPLFEEQRLRSHLPQKNELLIEKLHTEDGYHLFIYPFEGRNVHEGLGALLAYRLAQIKPITFSIAMNDYGLELLSDQEIPIEQALGDALFDTHNLSNDIYASINISEMSKRTFRDIATIAGLVFNGYPGKQLKTRHLQANSQLFYSVFSEYEPSNLLLQQAIDEVMTFQMEHARLYEALKRMETQHIIIKELKNYSPFCFPIFSERIRGQVSNEKMEERINKIINQL